MVGAREVEEAAEVIGAVTYLGVVGAASAVAYPEVVAGVASSRSEVARKPSIARKAKTS